MLHLMSLKQNLFFPPRHTHLLPSNSESYWGGLHLQSQNDTSWDSISTHGVFVQKGTQRIPQILRQPVYTLVSAPHQVNRSLLTIQANSKPQQCLVKTPDTRARPKHWGMNTKHELYTNCQNQAAQAIQMETPPATLVCTPGCRADD